VAGPELFTPRALTFLRALKRNNDSAWFQARKADYVAHIQEPLHRLIAALAEDLHDEAPELACSPRESTFRIYRDTRFSDDKRPLKTYIAWALRPRGFPKGYAASLYAEFDPTETWIGGGLYHPEPAVRHAVREHVAAHHRRLAAIAKAPALKTHFGGISGDRLTRVPRGFAPEHPAAEFLRYKQWLVSKTFPGTFVTTPQFYPTLLTLFRTALPLIQFLNEPIAKPADDRRRTPSREA
jgi:uncharacterized protein (TIGR02453 family)